jgi:TonB-linked SusC/RagA family outer membrane protein
MKKVFIFLLILITTVEFVSAQEKTISGKVTDASTGDPLPGVNIVIQGTTMGTSSDVDGNYSLSASTGDTLVFSAVGMQTKKVVVGEENTINVALEQSVAELEEVVVVGYGTKKKRDVVGSVAKVQSEDMEEATTLSIDEALQGMASGVQVTSSSGMPGANVEVKVRGINSISAGTDPLWVIDGMPVYSGSGFEYTEGTAGQNPMSLINPKNIESIEVLKGAAATSIYGSRGANGVIVVTTKSGKGKGELSVDYSTGLSNLTKTKDDIGYVNTREYFQLADLAKQNASGDSTAQFTPANVLDTRPTFSDMTREQAMNINTDWMDQILHQGNYHDLNISNRFGFEKGNIYANLNYHRVNSVLKNNELQRINARLNGSFNPVKNLTAGFKVTLARTKTDRVKNAQAGAIGTGGGSVGGFSAANRGTLPWFPVYDASTKSGYWSPASGVNLTASIDRNNLKDRVKKYRSIGQLYFEYTPPIKGLSVRAEGSYDFIQTNSELWIAQLLRRDQRSYAYDRAVSYLGINYNLVANYNRTFGDHSIQAVLGTESHSKGRQSRNMEGKDLIGHYQELGNPQTRLKMTSRYEDERYLRAFFSRATYKFRDRYLLGFSFRTDGSSKFKEDYRWGYFPAVKGGWIISDEPFFSGIGAVNMIKLRGSYGITGNQSIPPNKTETVYDNEADNRYGHQSLIGAGTKIENIGNPTITWETTNEFEAGVDFGFFENRINGSFAYYNQKVTDLLLKASIPPSTGLSGGNVFWDNIGDMRNYGFEFNITTVNIQSQSLDFTWKTSFNFSKNDNRVMNLTSKLDRAGAGIINGSQITKSDGRLNTYFMADYAGIHPEKGVEMIWEIDREHYKKTGETVKTGRKIPATLSNVKNHRYIHKNKTPDPKYYGGFTNTFQYKNFALTAKFNFSGGHYIHNYNRQRVSFVHNGQNIILKDVMEKGWDFVDNKANAKYPRIVWNSTDKWAWDSDKNEWVGPTRGIGNYSPETRIYDKFLYKGDYIRLKNVKLSYTLPKNLTRKFNVQNLQVYFSATNLLTITNYPGYDPEVSSYIYSVPLPHLQTYSLGLNLKL